MLNHKVKELLQGIKRQEQDDLNVLHLTAYDNRLSKTALQLLSSNLSQRYHLGTFETRGMTDPAYMGEFLFKGMPHVYEFENLAIEKTCEMFSAVSSDLRPLSGMHAMLCTIIATTKVGDVVYSIDCDSGGHFATQYVVERLGRIPATVPVDFKNLNIDILGFAEALKKTPANLVYFDVGCALFPLPLRAIRELVGNEALIVYDASHTQGLIAGGEFQAPLLEGADILQGNTHKTFPGPQKAMLHFKDSDVAKAVTEALNFGLVSSQHTHHSLALYLTILEMSQFGKAYAKQTICNAKALADALVKSDIVLLGMEHGYSQSNILLIDGDSVGGHVKACRKLYESNIATNSRHGYGKEIIRVGVQEATRRGMMEEDMEIIAGFFKRLLKEGEAPEKVRQEVIQFNQRFLDVKYSFDEFLGKE